MMRILYLGHPFFGYYKYIVKTLKEHFQTNVNYFNISPSTSPLYRTIKFNDKLKKIYLKVFFESIIKKVKAGKYDLVLFIGLFDYHFDFVERLRIIYKKTPFVLYQWDALKVNRYENLIPFFDSVFSFDRNDCLENSRLNYLPLFYLEDYAQIRNKHDEEIDLLFIGSGDNERFKIIKAIERDALEKGKKFYYYLYLPRLMYGRLKLFDKNYSLVKLKDINFKKISHSEIVRLFSKSRAILDIERFGQGGLTMRTFETLGSNRKLITTNKNIQYEPFYNNAIIQIIDRNKPAIDWNMIKKKNDVNSEIIEQYSLKSWISTLITQ